MNRRQEDRYEAEMKIDAPGFTELKWQRLGGACEGANVPGGVVMVVSMQGGGGGVRVKTGLTCAMTFVPNVAVVDVGGRVGLVSTVAGQFDLMAAKLDEVMKKWQRHL